MSGMASTPEATEKRAPARADASDVAASESAAPAALPRQVPYIIANEACERFSVYGMRNIPTPFLVSALLVYLPEADRTSMAKEIFHTFVIGVYFFPLLGGWISDQFFGKSSWPSGRWR